MTAITSDQRNARGALRLGAAAFVLLAACAASLLYGASADPADAARAKKLGNTKGTPAPSCPAREDARNPRKRECFAVGSVTGFQLKAGKEREPFTMPRDGRIVAWSVDLSRPRKTERNFFGRLFGRKKLGDGPTARIAVLKSRRKQRYKLKRQSSVVKLSEYLGGTPIFTLDEPLRAREGEIIALTTPTWMPNLAANRDNSRWRASRPPGKCDPADADQARPQQKVGSSRKYGCRFGDRLLYWAYYTTGD